MLGNAGFYFVLIFKNEIALMVLINSTLSLEIFIRKKKRITRTNRWLWMVCDLERFLIGFDRCNKNNNKKKIETSNYLCVC